MSITELLSLFEKAQKDYFIAESLLESTKKAIKNKVINIVYEKYKEEVLKVKDSVLKYESCLATFHLFSDTDYREVKVFIDVLFTTQVTKENTKILNKVLVDFENEVNIKADETIAKEFRYKLPLTSVLEGNFSLKF